MIFPLSARVAALFCGALILLETPPRLTAAEVPARSNGLAVARRYADTMIDPRKGRDHFGATPSPLFAAVLHRETYEIPEGKVEDMLRARVPQENKSIANPHYDQNLLQVLYALSRITGNPSYAREADATVKYFMQHCQDEKYGFYTWGEHVGWDLLADKLGGFPPDKPDWAVHEFWRPWIYWDHSFSVAREECHRFARALWNHQIDHTKPEEGIGWSRHAQFLSRVPSRRGYEFPRHGGFYIVTWAHAYWHTKDPEMLTAIEAVVDYFYKVRDPRTKAIPHCSSIADWLRPESTLSLAISLREAMPLVPEGLAQKMRVLAQQIDDVFLKLPHDPGPGGKGLVLTATLGLKVTPIWLLENGKWTTDPPVENVLPPRHEAYTKGWVSAYVGPVPHSTMIGYCIERRRQLGATDDRQEPDAISRADGYAGLIVRTADGYLDAGSELAPREENGKTVVPKVDTGTIGRVIGLMNEAWRLTKDEKYLRSADWYCDWAAKNFWPDAQPLPIPSIPFSEKQNYYSASARCDTLVLAMLETWVLRNKPELDKALGFRWTDL
jgi:hypothetical protein